MVKNNFVFVIVMNMSANRPESGEPMVSPSRCVKYLSSNVKYFWSNTTFSSKINSLISIILNFLALIKLLLITVKVSRTGILVYMLMMSSDSSLYCGEILISFMLSMSSKLFLIL